MGGEQGFSTFLQLQVLESTPGPRRTSCDDGDARRPTTLSIYLSCIRAAGIDQNSKRRSGHRHCHLQTFWWSAASCPSQRLNLPGVPSSATTACVDGDHHAQGRPGTADDGETRISLLCLSAELRPRAWRPAHGPHSAVHVSTTSADLDRPANSRVPRPAAQTEGVLLLLLRVLLRALTYLSCVRRLRASAPWLSVDLKVR